MDTRPNRTHLRGFGSATLEQKQRIASMGGKASHIKGTAHEWTAQEARQAVKVRLAKRQERERLAAEEE